MSSVNIYTKFKPTYLMVKRHMDTGLLYFCKTTRADPLKYLGSGLYWKSHIKKHGQNRVETIWHQLFKNEYKCYKFATLFSRIARIVESDSWANLMIETGTGAGLAGVSLEERHGKRKADLIRARMRESGARSYTEKYGTEERAREESIKRGNSIKNSPYNTGGAKKGTLNPNSKGWVVISPQNEVFDLVIKNMTLVDFCTAHDLQSTDMGRVASGHLPHSRLWVCFHHNEFASDKVAAKLANRDKLRGQTRNCMLEAEFNGEVNIFDTLKSACDYFNIKPDMMRQFLNDPKYAPQTAKHRHLVGFSIRIV